MKNLKPNEQRAKNAITLIWIVLAVEIISLISGYFQYNLLQSVANGNELSIEAANLNDLREQLIGIVYLIVFIISGITFICWFRRAYSNLHHKVNYLSHAEGWAAGSWFVPFINLFRPYQIMKELYQETKELLGKKGISFKQSLSMNPVNIWWALWVLSGIISQAVLRYSQRAITIDELTLSTLAEMAGNIIGIPLALITIKLIKDYSAVEPLLREIEEIEEIPTPVRIQAEGNINF